MGLFLVYYLDNLDCTVSIMNYQHSLSEFEGKMVTLEQIHLYQSPTQLSQHYKIITENLYLLVHGRQIHYSFYKIHFLHEC